MKSITKEEYINLLEGRTHIKVGYTRKENNNAGLATDEYIKYLSNNLRNYFSLDHLPTFSFCAGLNTASYALTKQLTPEPYVKEPTREDFNLGDRYFLLEQEERNFLIHDYKGNRTVLVRATKKG